MLLISVHLQEKNGGEIISEGKPKDILNRNSLTSQYLTGIKKIEVPEKRRLGNGKSLVLSNCTGNNLKNVTLTLPLGMMVGITGVSGSGKSSLINGTLYPILNAYFFNGVKKTISL